LGPFITRSFRHCPRLEDPVCYSNKRDLVWEYNPLPIRTGLYEIAEGKSRNYFGIKYPIRAFAKIVLEENQKDWNR